MQVAQFLGQQIPQPFANNGDLLINSLDNLSGGADLVSIRAVDLLSTVYVSSHCSRRQTTVCELKKQTCSTDCQAEAALAELNQDEDGNPLGN